MLVMAIIGGCLNRRSDPPPGHRIIQRGCTNPACWTQNYERLLDWTAPACCITGGVKTNLCVMGCRRVLARQHEKRLDQQLPVERLHVRPRCQLSAFPCGRQTRLRCQSPVRRTRMPRRPEWPDPATRPSSSCATSPGIRIPTYCFVNAGHSAVKGNPGQGLLTTAWLRSSQRQYYHSESQPHGNLFFSEPCRADKTH